MGTKLVVDLLDPRKFIKVNDLRKITNPIFFDRNNVPTSDGLLSNEIFGISTTERRETFAYMDLTEDFIHPLYYKIWTKVDSKVRDCVHGTRTFIINPSGYLEEDPNGSNGIKFLKENIARIKWKESDSSKRGENISFLMNMKEKAFMKELIVLPAVYRDVQTTNGKTGVGEINTIYDNILIAVRALQDAKDYAFTLSSASRGRIQELILQVYDWFGKGTIIQGMETSGVLPGKLGFLRRAGQGKTSDYAGRLVMCKPNEHAEDINDVMVDLTHSALPLSAVCVNFYPYMMFHVRRFFENEFGGDFTYKYIDSKGDMHTLEVQDPQIAFSDERIKQELDRFIHGYSNRLIPIEVPLKEKRKNPIYMAFKGRNMTSAEYERHVKDGTLDKMPIVDRPLTWCDVFFIAANEFVKDKTVLITRYPIDSYYNQFPTQIVVSSTIKTEPMVIRGQLIKNYPLIRPKDIGSNTSSMFIDVMQISNAHLDSIGGDYDGDQVSSKGVYIVEANDELREYMNSKAFYISLGGTNVRMVSKDGIQALYNLTKVLPGTKLTEIVE